MEQVPLPPAPSLGKSLTDVFASPSEIFTDLQKKESNAALWIVPLILSIASIVLVMIVGFTNENLKAQRMEAMRVVLEQRVAEGKMTQEAADQAIDGFENRAGFFLAIQLVAVLVVVTLLFFVYVLFLWLGGKLVLKSPVGYAKYLEVYGISSWIGILGTIVTLLMTVGLNSIYAGPNLALIVYQTFDPTNSSHKILALVNFFSIWQTAIIGIALSKLSGKGIGISMAVSFVVWIIVLGMMYSLGLGG